jgi:hypothetical protein
VGRPAAISHLAWERLCAARQRPDEAAEAHRAARAVLERVKTGLRDAALGASLERTFSS